MARVVVLGAGLAGLAVAARLADLRHDVTVLERAHAPGGQLRAGEVNGTTVDLGPAAFTMPAPLRELFRATGRPIEREVDLMPVDPAQQVAFADGTLAQIPNASRAGTLRALDEALGRGAGTQWDAVVEHGGRLWQHLHNAILGYARHPRERVPTLRSFAHGEVPDPRLRHLLDWYAASVGEDPARAPATITVLPYLEQTFGTWAVAGGNARLVDAVHTRALERGATVRTNSAVAAMNVDDGRVRSVALADGEGLDADVVVSAITPAALRRLLPGRRDPVRHRTGIAHPLRPRPGPARSSFCVLVEVHGPEPHPEVRTVVLPPDGEHPAVTVNRASPSASGAGMWALHADCAAHGEAPGYVDWSAPGAADAHAEYIVGLVAASGAGLGQPVAALVRTPLDLERHTGAPGGAIHGRPGGGRPAYLSRPANRTRVRGLFLAGAGAHPGPGIAMTVISSGIVADLIGRA